MWSRRKNFWLRTFPQRSSLLQYPMKRVHRHFIQNRNHKEILLRSMLGFYRIVVPEIQPRCGNPFQPRKMKTSSPAKLFPCREETGERKM